MITVGQDTGRPLNGELVRDTHINGRLLLCARLHGKNTLINRADLQSQIYRVQHRRPPMHMTHEARHLLLLRQGEPRPLTL